MNFFLNHSTHGLVKIYKLVDSNWGQIYSGDLLLFSGVCIIVCIIQLQEVKQILYLCDYLEVKGDKQVEGNLKKKNQQIVFIGMQWPNEWG
jgi:hypothetical protein